MTHTLILAMALGATLLAWLKLRRLAMALGIAAAVLFLLVGYGLLARPLLALQDGYDSEVRSWGHHNAIILLGAGQTLTDRRTSEPAIFGHSRFLKALQVYHACKQHSDDCKIIASGGDNHHYGTSEARLFGALLASLGVPADDVLLEDRSRNTWENAKFSAAFFANHRFDRAYLVTSGFHLPRATRDFAHFGVPTTPVRADYRKPSLALYPLSNNFFLTDVALHEHLGTLHDDVYNALGWYDKPTTPDLL